MKYKAVIFDLDGVICSTDDYHFLAWKQLADDIGIPFDKTMNNRLRGVSRMESLENLLGSRSEEFPPDIKRELAEKKNGIYRKLLENLSPKDLDPDVKETLSEIKNRGIRIAIGSSSKNAKMILEKLGLDNFFHAISDGTNITRSKPDPEVFLKASAFLNVEPRYCLVVEDAISGLEAAAAAGMDSAAIGDAAESTMALYRLKKLSDLLPHLI